MLITTHELKNGMKVVLEEKHSAPVISYNIVVNVGSAAENDKEGGMCHLIEHMVFKGTPTRRVGQIAREVEASGGEINAYTSFDQTVFYINMASRFSERGLRILADTVKNPLFDETELEREKEVILEEIRREKDNPMHFTVETLFSHSFRRHNYGRPIIGFDKTVRSFTRDDVIKFYQSWYTPRNMSIVIVGDFDTDDVLRKAEREFSDFHGPEPPKRPEKTEPPQKKFRLVTDAKNIQATYFALGFHIPAITHYDVPALDLIAHILAGGESSRFEQIIKERKRLVHQIYSYAFTPKDPGLFIIGGIMQTEKVVNAIGAVWQEIEKLHNSPVTEEELKRAKTNIRSAQIYEKETVGGEAGKIAYFLATAGSHEYEGRYYQMVQDMQAEDLKTVAAKYLSPDKCTMVLLNPLDKCKTVKPARIKSVCSRFKPSAEKKFKRVSKPHLPVETRLSNGTRLIVKENHELPIISISAVALGGLRFENRKNNGISSLIARTVTKGTKSRTHEEIAREIESIAGRIDGEAGRNSIGVTCEFLSDRAEKGFEIFGDVLSRPSFSNKEVSKEKVHQIEAIRNQEDALGTLAMLNFQKTLFKNHPYGMRLLGEEDTVRSLRPLEVRNYYFRVVNPKNLVIAVAGDIDVESAKKMLERYLSFKPVKGRLPAPPQIDPPPKKIMSIDVRKPGKEQAHIVLGFQAPRLFSPDHYVMTVMNYVLSGQGGRLFLELRDRLSLAYAVTSTYQPGLDPGLFAVYIGTEPRKIPTAVSAIRMELEKLTTRLIADDELERAKQYLIGVHELELQKNSSLASSCALNVLYGAGLDEVYNYPEKIMAVSREDIHRIAKKYINLNAYAISIVKPG